MLPPEIAKQIRLLEIRTNRVVDEITGGAYRSVFKGRGIEFDEVREYTPEDDVRDIDWNVSARMGAPYVKKYMEDNPEIFEQVEQLLLDSLKQKDEKKNDDEAADIPGIDDGEIFIDEDGVIIE